MEAKISLWITIVVSLFSGSIGAAITAFFNIYQNNVKKKKDFLEQQLQKLYGPLYWNISQIEKLFELNRKIMNAYDQEYCDSSKEYSQEKSTQDALKNEVTVVIDVANAYITKVEQNSNRMMEILNDNYSYIDVDDISLFQIFYEHKVRIETEREQNGRLKLPIPIYNKMGNISFLKPEVMDCIKKKFLDKKSKWEK